MKIDAMKYFLFLFIIAASSLSAAYIIKDGSFINTKDMATLPVEEHYHLGMKAIEEKNWQEALHHFRVVTINFPLSSWANEAFYFLGVSYYHNEDYELADRNISLYLRENQNPKYFEECFQYKLAIANAFANGARKHLFGLEKMPQWFGAEDLALAIYDEIISSLPHHELAAKALLAKASFLIQMAELSSGIETYQSLIKKFPRSEFAAIAYASIGEAFCKLAELDTNNPDILPLAEINARRFSQDFPKAESILALQNQILEIKELLANALLETGRFYERKGQPKASVLYYHTVCVQYPDTKAAGFSKERLKQLDTYAKEIALSSP
jgi:outer membrane protein assembly factor BamD (BamD/ComL family)